MENRLHVRFRVRVGILITACAQLALSTCSRTHGADFNLRSVETSGGKTTTVDVAEVKLPPCPPAGSPAVQPSAVTGHHKVTLSWNASPPSALPEDNAVGYCLYRSRRKNAAHKTATCRDCEQINSIPIEGTSCRDDLVADGITYYYVVAAISLKGRLSSPSTQARAAIPGGKTNVGSASNNGTAINNKEVPNSRSSELALQPMLANRQVPLPSSPSCRGGASDTR